MATVSRPSHRPDSPILTARQIVRALVFLLITVVPVFLAAGTLAWWPGWVYLVVGIGSIILGRMHVARRYPDLIRERASYDEKRDVPRWDHWLMPLVALLGPLVVLVVAGLDERFGWSPDLGLEVQMAGLAGFVLCIVFGHWATISNRFFSSVVRIQTERGHHVVNAGPYRIMRHPAYAAAVLSYAAIPLLLDSLWAYIPAALIAAAYVVRTALEDQMLRDELAGYAVYAQSTRYRLVPGIW